MYFFFVRISCVQILAKCNIQILYILQAHLRPLESPATDKQTKLPSFSSCLWIGFSFRSFFCITTNTFPFSPFVFHHVSLHVCLHCRWEKILNLMQKKNVLPGADKKSKKIRKSIAGILMAKNIYQNRYIVLFLSRVAEYGSLSLRAKMAIKFFVKCVFTIFATNASFCRVIAKLPI